MERITCPQCHGHGEWLSGFGDRSPELGADQSGGGKETGDLEWGDRAFKLITLAMVGGPAVGLFYLATHFTVNPLFQIGLAAAGGIGGLALLKRFEHVLMGVAKLAEFVVALCAVVLLFVYVIIPFSEAVTR